jgi:hypothetical protein
MAMRKALACGLERKWIIALPEARGFGFGYVLLLLLNQPVRRGERVGTNPAGAAHKDVRRFRRRRKRLTEIPDTLADPTAPSLGAALGRLSFGYFSLPFKEK